MEKLFNVNEELLKILQKSNKEFISLSNLRKAMSADLRKQLKIASKTTTPDLRKILTPHIGATLTLRKGGRGGRSYFLATQFKPEELLLSFIRTAPGKKPSGLGLALPLGKAEILGALNNLLKSGEIRAELKDYNDPRFYAADKIHAPMPQPEVQAKENTVIADPDELYRKQKAQFKEAFDDLDRGRIFVNIFEIRRQLGYPRDVFDDLLKRLRKEKVIQLNSGDVTLLSADEVDDSFIDENGFRMGTVTLRK